MPKDHIIIGTVSGILGAIIKIILNILFWKLEIINYLSMHLAASVFIVPEIIYSTLGITLGLLAEIIVGATLGILTLYYLKISGRSWWFYKGIIWGSLIWFWGMGVASNLIMPQIDPAEPIFFLTSLLEHIIFGIITSFFIVRDFHFEY